MFNFCLFSRRWRSWRRLRRRSPSVRRWRPSTYPSSISCKETSTWQRSTQRWPCLPTDTTHQVQKMSFLLDWLVFIHSCKRSQAKWFISTVGCLLLKKNCCVKLLIHDYPNRWTFSVYINFCLIVALDFDNHCYICMFFKLLMPSLVDVLQVSWQH